jgi:hypothetical protein
MSMTKSLADDREYEHPTDTLDWSTPESIHAALARVSNLLYQGKISPRAASVLGQLARESITALKMSYTKRLKDLEEAHAAAHPEPEGVKRRRGPKTARPETRWP